MIKKKILLVDDEERIAGMAKQALEALGGYTVRIETSGEDAIAAAGSFKPDLILLDMMMPGMSGLETCKRLKGKEKTASIPVVILSGNKEESYKVSSLDSGADDYIVKPFSLNELDARIRAVLRRRGLSGGDGNVRAFGPISMDIDRHQVTAGGKTVELTHTEYAILKTLISRPGFVFSRARILDNLWDSSVAVTERTVDVHIKHLREKLGSAGQYIVNVRSVGYKIDDEDGK